MVIDPERLDGYSAYELMQAAARGMIGLDQRWLHALVDDPSNTLPDIVRFAGEDRAADRVDLEQDLVSIFEHLKAPEGVPYFVKLIAAQPDEISDEVVEALAAIGAPAVEPQLKLCRQLPTAQSGEVAFVLASIGVKDPRILELLLARLDVDLEEGVFHLEIYGDPAAIPVLEQRLARTTDEEQQLELSDTIRDLGQPSEPSTPIDFNIWELYPAQSSPDFGQLNENERLEFLTTGTPAQRAEAAESFQGDEELSPQAKAKLLDLARHDPDPAVRGSCWACFFNATDDPEMRKALLERLQDPETPELERVGVALGLVFHTDQAEVHDALIAAAQNPQTRAKALEGMWRSFNQDFTPEASEHLDDPDPEVRRQAIWMVGYLQIKELAAELRKFFRDDELREDAIHNYACVYPGPLARARTMELLKKIDADAGGLSNAETEWVKAGLDLRLIRAGSKPFFDKEAASEQEPVSVGEKVGRNDPCPCGSGKKYKKCCGQ